VINWTSTGFGKDYKVQVSADAVNWTDAVTVTGNTSGGVKTYSFNPLTCRYVRMNGTALGQGTVQYNIWELEVYGTSAGSSFMAKKNRAVTDDGGTPAGKDYWYPNPAHDLVQRALKQAATIQVFSADGRNVFTRKLAAGGQSLSLRLQPGVYFVRTIFADRSTETSRLIIE